MTKQSIDQFLNQTLMLEPAAAGVSDMQQDYRRVAAGSGRAGGAGAADCVRERGQPDDGAGGGAGARDGAARLDRRGTMAAGATGAGGERVLALLAAAMGGLFAWWSAPFVVSRINPPDNPARLALPADWRVLAFGLALTSAVTLLFGLAPALRASAVKPASALKGGADPHSRRRLMHALIAVQVAFCFLVLFVAGLFAATFDRLSNRPTGFSAERILTLDTVAQRAQPPVYWDQVAEHLRAVPAWRRSRWRVAAARRGRLERLRFGQRRASGPGAGLSF